MGRCAASGDSEGRSDERMGMAPPGRENSLGTHPRLRDGPQAGRSCQAATTKGGDILDSELAGRTGAIESIEQDYEDRIHLSVVLDDDPGRDLGLLRLPGHRFFFSPEEVEPLRPEEK